MSSRTSSSGPEWTTSQYVECGGRAAAAAAWPPHSRCNSTTRSHDTLWLTFSTKYIVPKCGHGCGTQRIGRVDHPVAAGDALVGLGRGDDDGVIDAQRVEHAARARHVAESAADGVVDDHRFRAISSASMMYFSVIGMRSKRKTAYDG